MDGHGRKNGDESDAGQVRSTTPARSPCQGKARYLPKAAGGKYPRIGTQTNARQGKEGGHSVHDGVGTYESMEVNAKA